MPFLKTKRNLVLIVGQVVLTLILGGYILLGKLEFAIADEEADVGAF